MMIFKIIPLEERIVFDADMADQINSVDDFNSSGDSDADANTDDSDDSENVSDKPEDVPKTKALVIASNIDNKDSAVNEIFLLQQAVQDSTIVITYDVQTTSLEDLYEEIHNSLQEEGVSSVDNIGFINHGGSGFFTLLEDLQITGQSLNEDEIEEDVKDFWLNVKDLVNSEGRIDLLSCNLTSSDEGKELVDNLEQLTGINVAASEDLTGDPDLGGDWLLETDGIDTINTYFKEKPLQVFDSVLSQFSTLYPGFGETSFKESSGEELKPRDIAQIVGGSGLFDITESNNEDLKEMLEFRDDNILQIKKGFNLNFEADYIEDNGNGTGSLTLEVSDGNMSQSLILSIANINEAPIITALWEVTNEETSKAISLIGNDPENDLLTFIISRLPSLKQGMLYQTPDGITLGEAITEKDTVVTNSNGIVIFVPKENTTGTANFSYTASDGELTSTQEKVQITVQNVNDSPIFSQNSYDFSIHENSLSTSYIGAVTAEDPENESVTFSVTQGNEEELFNIDSDTGNITVNNGLLDYEANSSYTITVAASDGETSDTTTVSINVLDTNEAPTVDAISEETPEDTQKTITLTGNDPEGEQLEFSISRIPNTNQGLLYQTSDGETLGEAITQKDTVVTNSNGLVIFVPENNVIGSIGFGYKASDSTLFSEEGNATIEINEVNDAPIFSQESYEFSIHENTSSGAYIGNVNAVDPEMESITYSITQGNTENLFSIDVNSGSISLNTSSLDYESNSNYAITVNASDGSSNYTADVTINVIDIEEAPIANDVSVNTDEDTNTTITLSSNIDEGENISFIINRLPSSSQGTLYQTSDGVELGEAITQKDTVVTNSNGLVIFVPILNANGSTNFGYLANNEILSSEEANVSIEINAINDAPIFSQNSYEFSTYENSSTGAYIGKVNAVDPESSSVTYSILGEENNTLFSIDNTGNISANTNSLNYEDISSYTLTINAFDGQDSDSANVVINIIDVSEAPTVTNLFETTDEDTNTTITLSGNSPDEKPITFIISQLPDIEKGTLYQTSDGESLGDPITQENTTVLNENGLVIFSPTSNSTGDLNFFYTSNDGDLSSEEAYVTITINITNDAPSSSEIHEQVFSQGIPVHLNISTSFSDLDGDTLTYSANGLPEGLSITSNGIIEGEATNTNIGVNNVTITASDGDLSTSETFSITIINANDAPTTTSIPDIIGNENVNFSMDVSNYFSDPDEDLGDQLTYTGINIPQTLNLTEDGIITGIPSNEDAINSPISIAIIATDSSGLQSINQFDLTIENANNTPTSIDIPNISSVEGSSFALNVANYFSDVDEEFGDQLTYTSTNLPSSVTLSEDGIIVGFPTNDDAINSPITVTITATDSEGSQISNDLTITVNNVNDNPTTSGISDVNTQQDSNFSLDISSSFTDVDTPLGDTLTFTSENLPDSLSISEEGIITGIPTNDDAINSPITVTVTATDSEGSQVSSQFSITVDNVNDSPTSTQIPDATATENSNFSLDVSGSFSDIDTDLGDSLTYTSNNLPNSFSISSDGVITGTPTVSDADNSPITVTITATDTEGAQVNSSLTIEIEDITETPSISTVEDVSFSWDASDYILNLNNNLEGDITFTSAGFPHSFSVSSDGLITGIPTNSDAINSPINVMLIAIDTSGHYVINQFILEIENVNDNPTTTIIPNAVGTEGTEFNLDISNSFSDIDIPAGDSLTFTSGDLPDSLIINEHCIITGTPTNDDAINSPIEITVTATDSEGSQITNNFFLTVQNINNAPIAINNGSTVIATEDSDFQLDSSDYFSDQDSPLGDQLNYTAINLPNSMSIDSEGVITGIPTNSDAISSPVSITIIATDSEGLIATNQISISIENVNDTPTSLPISDVSTQQGSSFSLDVSGSFSDIDTPLGDVLTFSSDNLPSSLSINEDGVITGTPTNTDAVNSPITVTITATDADGEQTSSDLTITIANVNDGPTSSAIPDANAQQDSGFSLDVSGSFADADTPLGDTLTFTSDDLPDSLSINEDGVITGTPTNTDAVNSPITVTITATDTDGEQTSSDLTITVANVNECSAR
jgi:large repetitive protein